MRRVVLIGILAAAPFTACGPCGPAVQVQVHVTNRSGPLADDYVEEPISTRSAKYARALEVSNATIDELRAGKSHQVYSGRFGDVLRGLVSEDQFENSLRPLATYGPVREYKPMQWSFATRIEKGRELLYSTKLVEHEKGRILYVFVFENDGKYERFVGFHWRPYTGVHTPGQI